MQADKIRRTSILAALTVATLALSTAPADGQTFLRGDANADGAVSIADPIFLLNMLFVPNAPQVVCQDAGDGNDDGAINIADPVYVLNAIFIPFAPPIPAPWPAPGTDPTPDTLTGCGPAALPFTTISIGDVSGHTLGTQSVFYDNAAWTTFWTTHSSDPVPFVDFNVEMVVAVLQMGTNLGMSVEITGITDTGSGVEVDYTYLLPGVYYPMSVQPHHFVRTTHVATPVTFNETVIALP